MKINDVTLTANTALCLPPAPTFLIERFEQLLFLRVLIFVSPAAFSHFQEPFLYGVGVMAATRRSLQSEA